MMYMHYCKRCHKIFMLNGHKMSCPKCRNSLTELTIPYMEYVNLDKDKRDALIKRCADEEELKALSTTYRMYKYSKWYRELQNADKENMPEVPLPADSVSGHVPSPELSYK